MVDPECYCLIFKKDICQHNIPSRTKAINATVKGENKNKKKGNDSKPEDKENNTTGTEGTHVGEVITPKDFTTQQWI